ncbi:MAG TPA: hypothetical protein VIV40_07690 [Kofleriaceae bacterium]
MVRFAFVTLLVFGCGRSSGSKPAGTTSDPVVTCTKYGDVCKLDKSRLGVCTQATAGSGFTCMSQH